jgi:hypothetical protein
MGSDNIPQFGVKTTGVEVVKTFKSAVDGKAYKFADFISY